MSLTKVVTLLGLVCMGSCQYVRPGVAPEPYDPNPQYSYSYNVADPVTGDTKSQTESRNGDVVQGSYSLVEPDGSLRTVEYHADPESGFNAVVSNSATGVVSAPAVAAPAKISHRPYAPAARPYHGYHGGYAGYPGYAGYGGYAGYRGYPGAYAGYDGYAGYHGGYPGYHGGYPGYNGGYHGYY